MIRLQSGSDTPLYRQLLDQIRRLITARAWTVGQRLPTVRALASELVINPNTVARAYRELEREGLVTARRGDGVFVADRSSPFFEREGRRLLSCAFDRLFDEAEQLGVADDELLDLMSKRVHERARAQGERA